MCEMVELDEKKSTTIFYRTNKSNFYLCDLIGFLVVDKVFYTVKQSVFWGSFELLNHNQQFIKINIQ